MEKKQKQNLVPEEAWVKILTRLSLRSIARFRSVCKEWKSTIDSDFFRDLYESVSSSSSSVSWSIFMNNCNRTEIIGHHRCERWGLTDSLGSFITRPIETTTTVRKTCVLSCTDGLVLLYTETIEGAPMYHVGNPLLRQWVLIPFPPHLSGYDVVRLQETQYFNDNGLVTKIEKGIVVGYKVVWTSVSRVVSNQLTFMIYSSETGSWMTKEVRCRQSLIWTRLAHSVPLNGRLHWLATIDNSSMDANYVVYYDFYSGGDESTMIPFPDIQQYQDTRRFKRTITTSAGSLMYCNVFSDNNSALCTIRVWRLVGTHEHPNSWHLFWQVIARGNGVDYFPLVMHPFNSDIMYCWSCNRDSLVMFNLRARKCSLYKEGMKNKSMDGCIMRISGCKEFMDTIYPKLANDMYAPSHNLFVSQFVLPRWLNPLPQLAS
ncbi:PREDICTED: putative F-box protein At3g23950 [Camelina sativa]|uniref:F-box protein At3g23950 n=1 Tax=Camelina sativa TaxID=90675 RepID=A0ABM0WA51_CAMSA|nr:PREDICTED: putative F-box protein At3g23950 [Camelina sativa]